MLLTRPHLLHHLFASISKIVDLHDNMCWMVICFIRRGSKCCNMIGIIDSRCLSCASHMCIRPLLFAWPRGVVHLIESITEIGVATVRAIDFDGTLGDRVEIEFQAFMAGWQCVKGVFPKFVNYKPDESLLSTPGWQSVIANNKLSTAAFMCTDNAGPNPEVLLRSSPSKTVFAMAKFKSGELTLVPTTNKFKVLDGSHAIVIVVEP